MSRRQKTVALSLEDCILYFIFYIFPFFAFCLLDFIFYILHFAFSIFYIIHTRKDLYEERRQEKKDASDNDGHFCIVNKGRVTVTELDEFSEKFQTASPHFHKIILQFFTKSLL